VTVVFVAELGVGYMSKVAQQASSLTQDLVTIAKPVSGLILLLLLLPNLMSMTHQYAEQNMKDMHRFLQVAGENSKR
jgi:flagellar biosynthesis protein FliR